jgi:ketosteroid isomerase-like protein
MSTENVEAIRRVYEAMARGDFWAAREVFDPEIVWEWVGEPVWPGRRPRLSRHRRRRGGDA